MRRRQSKLPPNQVVGGDSFFKPKVQTKLAMGKPGDTYEVEADRMADQVVAKTGNGDAVQKMEGEEEVQQKPLAASVTPLIQKMGSAEEEAPVQKMEEEEPVQAMKEEEEAVQAMEEEEEPVQAMEEEEEPVQAMEEEEPVQAMEEEEAVQAMEEEEEAVQAMEEEEVQTKKATNAPANSNIEKKLRNGSGGSKMDSNTRSEMEAGFGADFSNVNIHNDSEAAEMSQGIGAQAFTHGNDVYFNKGKYNTDSKEGKHLLAHELTHTIQQGAVAPKKDNTPTKAQNQAPSVSSQSAKNVQRRALTPDEERAAITNGRATFDERSIRIIQSITGTGVDGALGPLTVAAISNWQTAQGVADNGIVNVATLDSFVAARNNNQTRRHEAIRLVADFHNIDLTANTLTVYASRNAVSNTRFETGLRVIEIGTNFFGSSTILRNEMNTQLAVADPNPIMGPIPLAPAVLTPVQIRSAIAYNNRKFSDSRSISSFQHHLGMIPTGVVDADFVQRVAGLQNTTASLADVDGKIGPLTLRHLFVVLRNAGNHNAVINMLVDFYNMPHTDMVTALYFEDSATFTSNASTSRNPNGPTRVRVRKGLYQSFEGAVHTIRHELEHVRQNEAGIAALNSNLKEFLGEATEIMSVGMPHERLFNQTHNITNNAGTNFRTTDGMQNDARRLLVNWTGMTVVERRTNWARFVQVRNRIRQRVAGTYWRTSTQDKADWAAASVANRATWTALLASFNAQVRP
ncbi:DUF4157 domain-containing protein [Dokdonia ponticola]|uniref:DUF4157 domain-containing protein n=1 Tax=Dokdonia ponticola TaxID=2041041 RepID=A0ABV9I1J2_9FLAO